MCTVAILKTCLLWGLTCSVFVPLWVTNVCSCGAGNLSLWDCLTVFSCLNTVCGWALCIWCWCCSFWPSANSSGKGNAFLFQSFNWVHDLHLWLTGCGNNVWGTFYSECFFSNIKRLNTNSVPQAWYSLEKSWNLKQLMLCLKHLKQNEKGASYSPDLGVFVFLWLFTLPDYQRSSVRYS